MPMFKTPTSFYESMSPAFTFSTLIGIFPMFPVRKTGLLYASKKLHLLTVLFLSIYTMCFMTTIIQRSNNLVGQKFYKNRNKVSNFGLTLQFIFGASTLYTNYFMSFVHTTNVKKVMMKINEVDGMFKQIDRKIRYGWSVCYQIFIIFSGYMILIMIILMQLRNLRIEKFPPIAFYVRILLASPVVVLYGVNTQFGITVTVIYLRLKVVNEELEKIRRESRDKVIFAMKSTVLKNIAKLMKIHDILYECAHRTNLNYNVQMLPGLTQQFFISLYAVFYFYWMFSLKPFSASCWLGWGFFTSYEILHVALACHFVAGEAKIVGRKIHKILISPQNREIEEKLMEFSHQVMHSNFKFTLCGLFTIDATLLFNMIGSSTTFIVIMIQFQETITPTTCFSTQN